MHLIRSIRGQASIMIAVMMMTFIIFFTFVINTGMLVNAKINLQNAADMAAYAGAAVQARQLNQISYLNYEMRRQYKKFLFRYYVVGNMAQQGFPRTGGGGGGKTPMKWSPDGNLDYRLPVVCVIQKADDNFCQVTQLPKIQIPTQTSLDAVNNTLISVLKKIEQVRQANCTRIAGANLQLLRMWLWNPDPNYEDIGNVGQLTDKQREVIALLKELALGLGLVPHELLLKKRIDTLAEYVNIPPIAGGVTLDRANELRQARSGDGPANERALQAFFSAFYSLGDGTFNDASSIVMDELLPAGGLLKLNPIKVQFDAYAMDLSINPGADGSSDCSPRIIPDVVQTPIPLGVFKDPAMLTYYAVRLRAKAQVLFSPFGDLNLKAYAAARPFGSRIGPELKEEDFVRLGFTPGDIQDKENTGAKPTRKIPNLPVRKSDATSAGSGWDTTQVVGMMFQGFNQIGVNGAIPTTITPPDVVRAIQKAMAPNPYEGHQYNIINDIGDDPFVRHFGDDQSTAFWAPLVRPGKGDVAAELASLVQNLMGDTGDEGAALKAAFTQLLQRYVDKLRRGAGEGGEGMNIVRISNPFTLGPGANGNPPAQVSGDATLIMTDPKEFKTSWNAVRRAEYREKGRVGYSVKFVAFDSLIHGGMKPNGNADFTNILGGDDDFQQDAQFIKH